MIDGATAGPIVRINPNELSISDSDFYNEIYVSDSRRRTESYHSFAQGIDFEGKHILSTSSHFSQHPQDPICSQHRMIYTGVGESL